MEEEKYYHQWLQSIKNLTARYAQKLLQRFPDSRELLDAPESRLEEILPSAQLRELLERRKEVRTVYGMREEYEKLLEKGIRFVSCHEKTYPRRLLEIPDPPVGLYYRGVLPEKDTLSVAVIGSRECSEYGIYIARELGAFLGRRGVDVVSGMARGIDGISQQAALEAGGASYGVLGSGVDVCYPASNRRLYDSLIDRGGILSTYPPGTPAAGRNFPARNRIVSGLADALVVVEARVKSGTLITVDMALEQGREVYVVPGRVTDRLSDGCNRLLKQGAGVFLNPEIFLEELEELAFLKKIKPERTDERKNANEEVGHKDLSTVGAIAVTEVAEKEGAETEEVKKKRTEKMEKKRPEKERSKQEGAETEEMEMEEMETEEVKKKRPEKERSKQEGARQDESGQEGQNKELKKEFSWSCDTPRYLEEELKPVWDKLDLTPKSLEEIGVALGGRYSAAELGVLLLRLVMTGRAKQISAGHFCRM